MFHRPWRLRRGRFGLSNCDVVELWPAQVVGGLAGDTAGTPSSTALVLSSDRLTWLSRLLSLTGLMISSYLTYVYVRHQGPVCLAGSHGCVKVEQSRYARPGGIPMPVLGVVGYLMLFTAAGMRGQRARAAAMVLATTAMTVSACLTYLEVEVIRAICYWCISSAICAAVHVVVNAARYVRGTSV